MAITMRCACGKRLKAAEKNAGKQAKCPNCGMLVLVPPAEPPTVFDADPDLDSHLGSFLPGQGSGTKTSEEDPTKPPDPGRPGPVPPEFQHPDAETLGGIRDALEALLAAVINITPPADAKRSYKVLTQGDAGSSGAFDPGRIEDALNAHAAEGWILKNVATARVAGRDGDRDEIIIVMER